MTKSGEWIIAERGERRLLNRGIFMLLTLMAAAVSGLLVASLFPSDGFPGLFGKPNSIHGMEELFSAYNFSWLVWVALVPLLLALGALNGKHRAWKGFALGFLAGTVSCLIQFHWIATVSWLGALLMPLYLALYWGAFGAFVATLGKFPDRPRFGTSLRIAFCQAAIWAGLEWLRGWMLTGFSWNGLGMAFHQNPVMAQGADLFGVNGLSLILVFFQSLLVFSMRKVLREKTFPVGELATVATLIVAMIGYGEIRIGIETRAPSIPLKTLLVQNNIPQDAAQVLWTDLEVHQAYEDETLKGLQALKDANGEPSSRWPDWVMWPECALTGRILFTADGERRAWQINEDTISQVSQSGPFTLIYGVNEVEAQREGDFLVPKPGGRAYNSIAIQPPAGGSDLATYRKHHLVIFGETIPFVETVPLLKKIYEQQAGVPYQGSFTPGNSLEPIAIQVGNTRVGVIPTICFEDSVARLTRKFVRSGPQIIINVTNVGWFKESAAAAQHFADARFRAIELRRPMLRCANTGVSAAIDSTGSTLTPQGNLQELRDEKGSHFTRGSLLTELKIPLRPSFSLYALIGDWGLLFLVAAGLLLAIFGRKSTSAFAGS